MTYFIFWIGILGIAVVSRMVGMSFERSMLLELLWIGNSIFDLVYSGKRS